jgi:hypothetical protein
MQPYSITENEETYMDNPSSGFGSKRTFICKAYAPLGAELFGVALSYATQ